MVINYTMNGSLIIVISILKLLYITGDAGTNCMIRV